jgi:hypothetical protein
MSGGRRKAVAASAAGASSKKRNLKDSARAEEHDSQDIVSEAAADTEAEQEMANETDQPASGASDRGASSGGSASRLPAGLLERRLEKARKEKENLAGKVAELQKQVALQAAASPRSASAPKVIMDDGYTLLKFIFRKFIM